MGKAYMSDATDRYNAVCGATSLGRPVAQEQAMREAERIVAETEPREDRGSVSWVRLDDARYWRKVCAKRPTARPLWREQNDACAALSDSLRAILPELDGLAYRAAMRPFENDDAADYRLTGEIYLRNRLPPDGRQ